MITLGVSFFIQSTGQGFTNNYAALFIKSLQLFRYGISARQSAKWVAPDTEQDLAEMAAGQNKLGLRDPKFETV